MTFAIAGPNFYRITKEGKLVSSWNHRAVFYLGGDSAPDTRDIYKLDCDLLQCQWVLYRAGAFANRERRAFTAAIIPRWMASCSKP